ncbi:MAG: type 1 glutamine amidotransferase [Acidimicrobiia bacterium]
MRALIIEHDALSTPERVGDHLESRGFALEPLVVVKNIHDPEVTATFPDRDGYDVVVAMGAPWSAYEPKLQGWVRPEVEFVRDRLSRGTPILGICFGAQIMSMALGGTVAPAAIPEYGWGGVESQEPAIVGGPWFQYHADEFTLPVGAAALAHNESGLQAFSYGRSLGVQFHPEVTTSLLESWCAVGGDRKLIDAGLEPEELVKETTSKAQETQPALERMLDWWLEGL